MRIRSIVSSLLLALIVPISAHGQSGTAEPSSSQSAAKFAGVWHGEFDGLPGVDIVISDEGDHLAGAVLFFLHTRPDTNSSYTSRPGLPEPMLNLRLDDQALHFQVSHRRAHPPGTLHDALMEFRLELTVPDRAELVNQSEGAPALVMKRRDY